MPLEDINTEAWSSGMEVGRGVTTLPYKKENCWEASKKFSRILWGRPRKRCILLRALFTITRSEKIVFTVNMRLVTSCTPVLCTGERSSLLGRHINLNHALEATWTLDLITCRFFPLLRATLQYGEDEAWLGWRITVRNLDLQTAWCGAGRGSLMLPVLII
jgi:hypothetical protein